MLFQLLMLIDFLYLIGGMKIQVWSRWNSNDNIRYGIINQKSMSHDESSELCRSAYFTDLVTVRNEKESEDLKKIITEYRREVARSKNVFDDMEENLYWLGTVRSSSRKTWIHYDYQSLGYANWSPGNPINTQSHDCAVVHLHCSEISTTCHLIWRSKRCSDVTGITNVVCERRENRMSIKQVEKMLKSAMITNSTNSRSLENIVQQLYMASLQSQLDPMVVSRGIRILEAISAKSRFLQVTEKTVAVAIETVKDYQDVVTKENPNFSTRQRESLVKTIEHLLNSVMIANEQTSVSFNSSAIYAEVHYLNGSEIKGRTFTPSGAGGVRITVSREALFRLRNNVGVGNRSRLTFVRFLNSNLFPSEHIVSQVVSAQIDGQKISELTSPITFSIPIENLSDELDAAYAQCVSWNFTISSWSDQGCWMTSRNSTPECACSHMTNFALLVNLFHRPSHSLFNIVNRYIGAGSCVGFFLVFVIYTIYSELRNSKPGPVHVNMCFCYGVAYALFLSGSDRRQDGLTCLTITVLSHYFFLAGWFWTFIEALTMHFLLVRKSNFLDEHYYARASFLSYFVPLFIVAANVGLTVGYLDRQPKNGFYRLNENSFLYNSSYVSNYACWLTSYSLYFGFLAIGGVLFTMNLVIYGLVLRSLSWRSKKVKSTRIANSYETFKQVVSIGLLLGLVWLLAVPMEFLAMSPDLIEPVTFVFAMLIALQGIAIFYLLCLRHAKARRLWLRPMWRKVKKCASWVKHNKRLLVESFKRKVTYDVSRETTKVALASQSSTTVLYKPTM